MYVRVPSPSPFLWCIFYGIDRFGWLGATLEMEIGYVFVVVVIIIDCKEMKVIWKKKDALCLGVLDGAFELNIYGAHEFLAGDADQMLKKSKPLWSIHIEFK